MLKDGKLSRYEQRFPPRRLWIENRVEILPPHCLLVWVIGNDASGSNCNFAFCKAVQPIQKSTVGTEVISSTNKISHSIFPNPIGEVLTVEFELENPELVRLELMTTDGRIIQVLNAERRAAGNHAVQHDIGQLPAGTYWLVLQFDATRQVQRVVKL